MGGAGGPGGPCFFGRSSSSYGYPPHWSSLGSGFSTSSTAAANYRNYNFPGPIPEEIPKAVFGWGHPPPPPLRHGGFDDAFAPPAPPPSHHGGFDQASVPPTVGGYRHATSSEASASAFAASLHRPLSHGNISASSVSDLTVLFPPHGGVPPAVPLTPHPVPPHVPTPPAGLASGGIKSPPPVSSPPLVVTPLMAPLRPAEPIKLPALKDAKAYLDVYDIILYWLRQPEYSTQLLDESLLVTTPSNVEASLFWEGQIQAAVREGSLRFLFDNKGTLYHGKGFEMLAVLNQYVALPRL
jgi:hypothetical protein